MVAQTTVDEIEILGNQRVDNATILSFAGLERGQIVTDGELNDVFQRLIGSGLFETVTVTPRGSRVIIEVAEFPTINRISIEGNRRIDDDTLEPLLGSQSRLIYSPAQAEADAAIIAEAYAQSGRLGTRVQPKIIRRSENRVDLVFEVDESNVIENERISFVGNRAFSDRRLRRVLATKQAGRLRGLIRADTFIEDRIQFDTQLLTDFYRSRGFIDFQVVSVTPELSQDRGAVFITFNLIEGQPFEFNSITASSTVEGVDPDRYADVIDLRSGTTYSPLLIERTINRMEVKAQQDGLNFIRVTPVVTRNDPQSTIDVDFVIERGPRIFVERIDIEGNATTLDRVIRNQFETVEGDPFNPREIREASERLRALAFFEDVQVQTREGSSPDTVIVDVDVVEQPTGTLAFGGTFAAEDGFGLIVTLVERNFLGRGQTASLSFNTSRNDRSLAGAFIEPNFLDRDLLVSTSIGYVNESGDNVDFNTEVAFLEFGTTFRVSEFGRLSGNFGWRSEELTGLVSDQSSPILLREEGRTSGLVLGYDYVFDTRGGGLDPLSGVTISFGQAIEGLEVDGAFLRTEGGIVGERAVFGEEVLLRAALEGGAIVAFGEGQTRIVDRFALTRRQLRGFAFRGVGPRDTAAPNNDPLGGNFFGVLRLETVFPSGLPDEYGVDLALFYDTGSLWGLDDTDGFDGVQVDDAFRLRSVAGFSVLWTSPIGPLRFDFTRALKKEVYDVENTFDFTVATRF